MSAGKRVKVQSRRFSGFFPSILTRNIAPIRKSDNKHCIVWHKKRLFFSMLEEFAEIGTGV